MEMIDAMEAVIAAAKSWAQQCEDDLDSSEEERQETEALWEAIMMVANGHDEGSVA